ncbi:hypothetical protein HY989_00875 [Candidatus Micrarchaeota archaeon]|nr:hypothetical protein [Candidatus Micrarchaeota archaeon]
MENIAGLNKFLRVWIEPAWMQGEKRPIKLVSYKEGPVDHWKLNINYGKFQPPKISVKNKEVIIGRPTTARGNATLDFRILPGKKKLRMEGAVFIKKVETVSPDISAYCPDLKLIPQSENSFAVVYDVDVNRIRKSLGLPFRNAGRPDKDSQQLLFEALLKRLRIKSRPEIMISKTPIRGNSMHAKIQKTGWKHLSKAQFT